jgi:hypothetical protein
MAREFGAEYGWKMGLTATKVVLEGELGDVALPELVQMLCMAGNSREVDLTVGPGQVGRLTVSKGQVVRCVAFGLVGVEAFYSLMQQRKGRYVVRIGPELNAASVHMALARTSWKVLLMDAATRHDRDEANATPSASAEIRDGSELTSPKEVSEVRKVKDAPRPATTKPARPSGERERERPNAYVGVLQERATEAYLRKDLREALRLFECSLAIEPNDSRTLTNVARIKAKLGID